MALSNAERQQRYRDRQKNELATLRAAAKRTEPAPQREKKSKVPPIPTHARALRFDPANRPFDPVEAAEYMYAIFRECPGKEKPHLLARIKQLVFDMDPMWGGFRFPDIPAPSRNDSPAADEHSGPPSNLPDELWKLAREIDRRRLQEACDKQPKTKKWYVDKVLRTEQARLLDWIEEALPKLNYPALAIELHRRRTVSHAEIMARGEITKWITPDQWVWDNKIHLDWIEEQLAKLRAVT